MLSSSLSVKLAKSKVEKKRIVIAGQIPPPIGGQALMIEQALNELRALNRFEVVHLPFSFTTDVRRTRQAGLGKVAQLFVVLWRLTRIRLSGRIDVLLYPVGGPQLVPLVRDVCLLPWILLSSRKVALHFHAAGIAETLLRYPFLLRTIIRALYRKADAAIVMTEFGKRDAVAVGITNIHVVPHSLEDTYDSSLVDRRGEGPANLLYVGHLAREKGTPFLLEAFAVLRRNGVKGSLQLVGECLPSYSEKELMASIQRLGLGDSVELHGVLSGRRKWERYAQANLFVFPSVAPESFGLVTVEAMMWALPIVACDWRGNREILGQAFGGILFQPYPDPAASLAAGLRTAFAARERWEKWGHRNRQAFEENYKAKSSRSRLAQVLESL
jgi:glycosyltransferase involved in cell wall biosynthesis